MPASRYSQIVANLIFALGVAYIWIFTPPFFVTVIFTVLCITWSAWIFIANFRGADELQAASLKHALAAASGYGVPLTVAFVMLMIATPNIQQTIAGLAALSQLSPASAGFGLGVSFTVIARCSVFSIYNSVWWVSKR